MEDRWNASHAHRPGDFLDSARRAVEDERSMERLRAIAVVRDRLERIEAAAVGQAIAAGVSWASIGDALGTARQAAHAKHVVRSGRGNQRRRLEVDQRVEAAEHWAEVNRVLRVHADRVARRAPQREQA